MANKPLIGPYRLDPFQSQIVKLEWGSGVTPSLGDFEVIQISGFGPPSDFGRRLDCTLGTIPAQCWRVVFLVADVDVGNAIEYAIFEANTVRATGLTTGTTHDLIPPYPCFDTGATGLQTGPRDDYASWPGGVDVYPFDELEYLNFSGGDTRIYQFAIVFPQAEGPLGWTNGERVSMTIV